MAATGCVRDPELRASRRAAGVRRGRPATRARLAYRSGGLGTVYLGFPDESFPLDHPQQWLGQYTSTRSAYDLFPPDSPIRRLYEWPELTRFVAAILGLDVDLSVRRSARRAEPRGDDRRGQLQWHFDRTDFVVSLAIQDADVGGDFEVAPQIRTGDDEHYDDVARVLAGEREHGRHAADDAGNVAGVRRSLLDPPGEPDRRDDAPARRAPRLRHQAGHDVERPVERSALRTHRLDDTSCRSAKGSRVTGRTPRT